MIRKIWLLLILMLFCVPIYAKAKLKVYPNPWIPESGKSLNTNAGDEMKHGSYTADGWIKFEGVAEGIPDEQIMRHGGTLRVYDITGHLIRSKRWTVEEESKIPLPETSHELTYEGSGWPQPGDFKRELHIVHWDGKNNNYEYVESGVYIWIIEEDNGHKHDGKVVVLR